jgi:cell division protein FtsW (lipid II flippase)
MTTAVAKSLSTASLLSLIGGIMINFFSIVALLADLLAYNPSARAYAGDDIMNLLLGLLIVYAAVMLDRQSSRRDLWGALVLVFSILFYLYPAPHVSLYLGEFATLAALLGIVGGIIGIVRGESSVHDRG